MSLPPSARTESSVDADTVDADAWRDRATGAIVGAFIGDAMAMGCHWVYDHSKFVDLYGERVDTYLKPRADGFHADLEAGQYSQTSEICVLLLESLVEKGELDQEDFNSRFDKMLGSCDGQRGGSGRYTPRDICDVYRGRIIEKKEWGKVACGGTDSGDTLGRAALIGVRYAADMPKVAALAKEHVALQVSCPAVQCHAIAVALLTALFVRGEPFDSTVGMKLYGLVREGVLPFAFARTPEQMKAGLAHRDGEDLPEPDAVILPGMICEAAQAAPATAGGGQLGAPRIEPANRVVHIYGLACAYSMVLPAAYYIAGRHVGDVEEGIIQAVSTPGQNVTRAQLVGGFCGALGGASRLPSKWVAGLERGHEILAMARQVAEASLPRK